MLMAYIWPLRAGVNARHRISVLVFCAASAQVLPVASAAAFAWLKHSPTPSSAYHTSSSAWQDTAPATAGGEVTK